MDSAYGAKIFEGENLVSVPLSPPALAGEPLLGVDATDLQLTPSVLGTDGSLYRITTSAAVGEEGNWVPIPEITTLAIGEEEGNRVPFPEITTLAIGEEDAIYFDKSKLKAGESAVLTVRSDTPIEVSDLTISGGTIKAIEDRTNYFTAIFTPSSDSTDDGVVVINSQSGWGPLSARIAIDTKIPKVAISADKTNLEIGDIALLTFTLTEESGDFDITDVSSSLGQLFNFSGKGTKYTAQFVPVGWQLSDKASVSVGNGRFADSFGNLNKDGSEEDNSPVFTLPKAKDTATAPIAFHPDTKHYYQISTEGALWKDALVQAARMSFNGLGGYLGTSTTQKENDFIVWVGLAQGSSNRLWLGMSDSQTEGDWKFASGPEKDQGLDFRNWDTGEPNGGALQNYGALYPYSAYDGSRIGAWDDVHNDLALDWRLSYVIEYGGLPPSYSVSPSATVVNEGSSVTFTIDTKNVESGKTIDYTLSGVVPEEVVGGKLTGTTVVMQNGLDGRATVTVALLADNVSDRDKNLVLTIWICPHISDPSVLVR